MQPHRMNFVYWCRNNPRLLSTFPTQIDRYLRGYDLDFSKIALDISKGNSNKAGSPKYIFHIEVGFDGGAPEPTPGQTPPFNPNPDIYRKLDVKDLDEFLKNEKEEKEEQHNSEIKPRRNRGPGFF